MHIKLGKQQWTVRRGPRRMYFRDASGTHRSDGHLLRNDHEFMYSSRLTTRQAVALAFEAGYAAAHKVPLVGKVAAISAAACLV
jgi:hypothetical protein